MPRFLSIKNYNSENLSGNLRRGKGSVADNSRVWNMNGRTQTKLSHFSRQGSVKIRLAGFGFILTAIILVCGAFYLYQVNDLATKGYEIKDLEKRIDTLKKENEKNKIREVELKSMYNIEKTTENLDFVGSTDISYLEINGPVAINSSKDWTK